ncbi:hypothetical protein QOZ80_2AG0127650 [Eleusine coracana subsp. coracana]|nr:hypothetical protein QOZ80_2AG0127650 [Eleusine coracana subsp. coracana]
MAEDGHPVKLHVYDLSQGMARQLSATFLGKAVEAIWHTGVVVYGREYYFGGGIQHGQPGRTPYGTPVRVVDLGVTHVPREVFEDFLLEIGPRYTPATYNLLSHNCNNFSNEAAQFLAGASVPSYILELPNEVMNSPVGALILPMIQGLETSLRAGAVPQPPQFKPAPAHPAATSTQQSSNEVAATATGAGKLEADKTVDDGNCSAVPPVVASTASEVAVERSADQTGNNSCGSVVPPAVQPAAAQVTPTPAAVASQDPLVEAKKRVQEEIKREFAAIMATGTVRAGEAAAQATRRVMERHGRAARVATPS